MADDLTNAPDVVAAGDASTVILDSVGIRDIPDESGMIPASDVAALKSALERIKADNQDLKSKAKRADLLDELLGGADPADLRQKLAQLKQQEELAEIQQREEAEMRSRFERERAEAEQAFTQRIGILTQSLQETARSQAIANIGQQAGFTPANEAESGMFESFITSHVEFEYIPIMRGETVVSYRSEVKSITGPDSKPLGFVDDPSAPGEVKKADLRDFIRQIQQGRYGSVLQTMVAAYNKSSGAGVVGGNGRGGDIIMSRDDLTNMGSMSPAELKAIASGKQRVNVRP
jgi:hypothetical protein